MRQPISLLLLLAVAACGGSDSGSTTAVRTPATVTIGGAGGSIESFGDDHALSATVADASGAAIPGASVTWATSDPAVMSLSATSGGSVTATSRANGTATVTASASPASAQLVFTVAQKLATASVSPGSPTIQVGATQQLSASALDAKGTAIAGGAAGATWQSSATGVATVDAAGLVRGVGAGSATITATVARDGLTRTATSTVTVGGVSSFPSSASVAATPAQAFTPRSVDIAAGGTVTWNFGTLTHNVTFDAIAGVPASIGNSVNTQVARTFPTAGTFTYECTLHPGMTGNVVVH